MCLRWLRWAVCLHMLVGQAISIMKRMVSRHARVFPSPVERDFCFDLCGVGGFC
jgi:hypothetical protein